MSLIQIDSSHWVNPAYITRIVVRNYADHKVTVVWTADGQHFNTHIPATEIVARLRSSDELVESAGE